jgi:hypothetical protein
VDVHHSFVLSEGIGRRLGVLRIEPADSCVKAAEAITTIGERNL